MGYGAFCLPLIYSRMHDHLVDLVQATCKQCCMGFPVMRDVTGSMGRLDSQLDYLFGIIIVITSFPFHQQCDTTVLEHNVLCIIRYRMSNQPSNIKDHTNNGTFTILK